MAMKSVPNLDGISVQKDTGWRLGMAVIVGILLQAMTVVTAEAECVTAPQWTEGVKAHSQGVTVQTMFDLTGDEAKAAVSRLNAIPPQTAVSADHIVVLMAQDDQTKLIMAEALVGFFNGGCLVARMKPQADSVSQWINEQGEGV